VKRVLIVEDTVAFQEALSGLLNEMQEPWQIFSFLNGENAMEFVQHAKTEVDLALVDLGLPDMAGADLIAEIHSKWPEVPIVVISVFTNAGKVLPAIRAGAIGYLLKSDLGSIKRGVEQALAGEFPISPLVARHLINIITQSAKKKNKSKDQLTTLSPQEHRLLEHIASGLSYAEVAKSMKLSLSTVQTYSRNLFRKLDVHSKTQAIVRARDNGLID